MGDRGASFADVLIGLGEVLRGGSKSLGGKNSKDKLAQLKFQSRFNLPELETLITRMSCAMYKSKFYHPGRMYVSKNYICFRSKATKAIYGELKEQIKFEHVMAIEKRNSALVLPNAIEIHTLHSEYFFASFLKRDQTLELFNNLWEQAQNDDTRRSVQLAAPKRTTTSADPFRPGGVVLAPKGGKEAEWFRQMVGPTASSDPLLLCYDCVLEKGNVRAATAGKFFVTDQHIYFVYASPQPNNQKKEVVALKEVMALEKRPGNGIKVITTTTRFLFVQFADQNGAHEALLNVWLQTKSTLRVFGGSLKSQTQGSADSLPPIMSLCLQHIKQKGLKEDGIFRVNPNKMELDDLKLKFENAAAMPDLNKYSVHTVAAIVKNYLKSIPQPLLGWFDTDLSTDEKMSAEEKLKERVLPKLPAESLSLLKAVVEVLHLIAEQSATNSMSSPKLAQLFAPILYPMKDSDTAVLDISQTAFSQELVRTLIEKNNVLFA